MKSTRLTCIIAVAVSTVAIPASLAAQRKAEQGQPHQHHHYQLIDMGTLGGPNSFAPTPWPPPLNINSSGLAIAGAGTSIPDPYAPNCFDFDCLVGHAITWRKGVQTDLGALPGVNSSFPAWVNDHGEVVGLSENGVIDPLTGSPEIIGVLWKDGQILDPFTLGGNASYPNAINNRGEVVGAALNAIPDSYAGNLWPPLFPVTTQFRAFLWRDGVIEDLGTLGTGNDAGAVFVNERGQVAGLSYTNTTPNPTTGIPTLDPFFWENGRMVDIGTLGGTIAQPFAMNNRGQVAGVSKLAGDQQIRAFLWDKKRGLRNLGTLPGGTTSIAIWMNDAGDVVGQSDDASTAFFGFLWKNGVMTNLGTVAGDVCSIANSINSQGQIIGVSSIDCSDDTHWFLWENGGPAVDLQTLVLGDSGVTLNNNVAFINDRGEIEGEGNLANGDSHSILLIPCDENHPGVEGCDYSMVDASTPSQSAAPRDVPSGAQRLPRSRWTGRYHSLRPQSTSISPEPDSSQPASTPCYVNPGICITLTAQSPVTISPGGTVTYTVTLEARGGFNGEVGLSCSVQPSPALAPTCLINGLNDGKASPGGPPISMVMNTTGPTAAVVPFSARSGLYALWLPLMGLVGVGVGSGLRQNKKGSVRAIVFTCMLFAGSVFLVACGSSSNTPSGGGNPGTPLGPYTITVTGVPNGAPTVSITTILTVQ